MVDRILDLIREKKLTPSQFADEIGIQRSGMSHIISGRNKPSLEVIMKVLKRYPDVKPEWLLYGTTGQETDSAPGGVTVKETGPDKGTETGLFSGAPGASSEEPEGQGIKPENKPLKSLKKEKTERKIEKIVVFYDDRTFREYEPEK